MLRLHERTQKVDHARIEISEAFMALVQKHDLTDIESLQILVGIEATTLKYMLRAERHPDNPGKKADEA